MAINKNAFIRYQVLDKCFRNPGRMYFWEDLLEECNKALLELNPLSNGIQRRQLFQDISFMESEQGWSVPLEKLRYGRKVYYRYSDLHFSINSQPLNETEANQIKSALMILSRFTGSPQFDWIKEIIPAIEDKLGLVKKEKEVIAFDANIDLKGIDFLSPIFNAILNKRVLNILYKDFKTPKPYNIVFHPYYLKQYNNRWFVLGHNPERDTPYWNIALDRIENISETNFEYVNTEIDWEDYFYDIIGVTMPEVKKLQEVVLEFSLEQAPYITTKPLHPSQKHNLDESGLNVRLNVIPNYELERLILSFGDSVKVVSPKSLKEQISARLKKASKFY
jgi:predicted DNA-binding transcriptional regulator YafY